MPDEPDTPLDGGTDNVTTQPDTPETFDWYDPDDDQDTAPAEPVTETDEGTEEAALEEQPEPEAPALVTLPDGTQAPLEEVTKGYLRQADYTRKSQELSQKRQAVEADLQRIDNTIQAFVDHLSAMVPEPPKAPPAAALAYSNPQEYMKQKAVYDAQMIAHQNALAQVDRLVKLGEQPKEIKSGLDTEADAVAVAEMGRKLQERFPVLASQDGGKKFTNDVVEAAKSVGFGMDDLSKVRDDRIIALAYWANVGMKAEKAREAAKAKVANVPPATPRKPGQPGQASGNGDAMRKLAQSGSIRDALKVDWD